MFTLLPKLKIMHERPWRFHSTNSSHKAKLFFIFSFLSCSRISQFDPTKQRLYYIYPQTRQTTWTHPLGQAADAQELARFYQIQQLHQQQYGGTTGSGGYNQQFMDSYNRKGGLGSGAKLALGVAGGKEREGEPNVRGKKNCTQKGARAREVQKQGSQGTQKSKTEKQRTFLEGSAGLFFCRFWDWVNSLPQEPFFFLFYLEPSKCGYKKKRQKRKRAVGR